MKQLWEEGKIVEQETPRVPGCGMYGGDYLGGGWSREQKEQRGARTLDRTTESTTTIPIVFSQNGRILLRGEKK